MVHFAMKIYIYILFLTAPSVNNDETVQKESFSFMSLYLTLLLNVIRYIFIKYFLIFKYIHIFKLELLNVNDGKMLGNVF